MIDVLKNAAFVRLWLIQATTQILQNMVNFALLLRVRDVVEVHNLPNANTVISLVIIAFSLPAVIFGPIAGVVADRTNKRNLMMILNLGRSFAMLLFLAIRPEWQVETILVAYYVVTFIFGIAGQFFAPLEGAMIPMLAKRNQLMPANALFNLTSTAAQLIGFAAAGPIVVRILGVDRLFIVALVAYAICALAVFTLPKTPVIERLVKNVQPMKQMASDIKEGLVYILQDPALLRAIAYLTVAQTTFLMVATLGPDFVTSIIGLSAQDLGLVVAPAGGGILLGVIIVPRVVRRVGRLWLINGSLAIAGLMLAFMALVRPALDSVTLGGHANLGLVVFLLAIFAAILGVANAFIIVPSQTMLQERSHEAIRARVFATFFTVSNSVAFVPIFFAAAAADVFGVINILLVMAACVGGLGIFQIIRARSTARARWERVRTRHRLGPETLPRRKSRSNIRPQ